MLDFAFQPDRGASMPIYRQLAEYLRELIAGGRLLRGEKLPASRELASALGMGRNTINQAYRMLIDDGALLAHVGQGTFVSSRGAAQRPASSSPAPGRAFAWEGLFARAARAPIPTGLRVPVADEIRFDFSGGRVDASALPHGALRRAYSRAIREALPDLANERDPLGHAPLRGEIARMLVARGIRCEPDQVIVTAGAQQALDLVSRVLLDPGDAVAVEQPCYFGATLSFQAAGAQLVAVDVDHDGLRTDSLARALRSRRIKLIYTTPSAQMPTGAVLSAARRRALLELADETQTPILEDDFDSEFRHGDPALPALKTQDPADQVIYVGTFSKALFPGLRIGYAVAARPLLARLAMVRFSASFGCDALSQAALAGMLASGALERHLRRTRRRYAERRDALLAALEASMPEGTRWSRPRGGLGRWVSLPPDVDPDAVQADASKDGIAYLRGDACYIDGRGAECLALSFANQSCTAITEGIARLGEIAHRHRAIRRSA